jgi:sulfite exporter TauE/SafE
MCGGFAATCARRRGGLPAWHAGRLTAYAILGALAGSAGTLLAAPAWVPALFATGLLVWFSLALAGVVAEPRVVIPGLASVGARALASPSLPAHFGFGIVNGLLPCGLVYSALALSAVLGGAVRGALGMALFGLGTIPLLSVGAVALERLLLTTLWRRRLVALLVLLAGCWTIWARVRLLDDEGARSFLWHCVNRLRQGTP